MSKKNRPIGEYATKLINQIIIRSNTILYSETLVHELCKDYSLQEITDMLNILLRIQILKRIEITQEEYKEAKDLSRQRNIPFVDCINSIHARNHNAKIITRDRHFFQKLTDICQPYLPEYII